MAADVGVGVAACEEVEMEESFRGLPRPRFGGGVGPRDEAVLLLLMLSVR